MFAGARYLHTTSRYNKQATSRAGWFTGTTCTAIARHNGTNFVLGNETRVTSRRVCHINTFLTRLVKRILLTGNATVETFMHPYTTAPTTDIAASLFFLCAKLASLLCFLDLCNKCLLRFMSRAHFVVASSQLAGRTSSIRLLDYAPVQPATASQSDQINFRE